MKTQTDPIVQISRRNKVTYEERTALFGLITWRVKISTEKIGDDLIIETDRPIDRIYFNGKLISIRL
jgi:hypothetical protein